jgi:hypothetical protein
LLSICNTDAWDVRPARRKTLPGYRQLRNGYRETLRLNQSGAGGGPVNASVGRDWMFVAPHGGFWNLPLGLLFFPPV